MTDKVESPEKESTESSETKESKKQQGENVSLSSFFAIKSGMTTVFDKDGKHVPVTVVKLIPNVITQVKTSEKMDIQLTKLAMEKKESHY